MVNLPFFKKYKEEIDYEFRIMSSSIRKIKGWASFTEKLWNTFLKNDDDYFFVLSTDTRLYSTNGR